MKTLRRKLFLSILAVAFAVVSLATSTFAWFALNDTVSVNEMTVKVNANYSFLLIGDDTKTTVESIQALTAQPSKGKTVTATNTVPAKGLYPVAHKDAVTDMTTADAPANWYYMYSDQTDVSTGVGTKTDLTSPEGLHPMSQYVLVNTFNLCLAEGSVEMTNLRVKSVTFNYQDDAKKAVKILVAGATGVEEFGDSTADDYESNVTLASSITDSAVTTVKVYIYWDGNHNDVTTNNAIAELLKDTAVSLQFTATNPVA